VIGLQGRIPNTSAGNWFQCWIFLFTKEYFPALFSTEHSPHTVVNMVLPRKENRTFEVLKFIQITEVIQYPTQSTLQIEISGFRHCEVEPFCRTLRSRLVVAYRRFGQPIIHIFKNQAARGDCLTIENGNDTLFRNVGDHLPTYCVTSQNSGDLTLRLICEGPLNNAGQGHNGSH